MKLGNIEESGFISKSIVDIDKKYTLQGQFLYSTSKISADKIAESYRIFPINYYRNNKVMI